MKQSTDDDHSHPQALIQEQLSALWDGELSVEESVLLEKRLQRDRALQQTLVRYSVVGAVIRQASVHHTVDVVARVRAELDDQPATAPVRRPVRHWLGGLAVAASVTLVAVWVFAAKEVHPPLAKVSAPAPAVRVAATHEASASANHVLHDPLVTAHLANPEPYSYVTPGLSSMPQAEMARYVAAHVALVTPAVEQTGLIHLLADEGE